MSPDVQHFRGILDLAESKLGSTAPNPSVAAVALDASGNVLAQAFHPGAGQPHAEALAIEVCRKQGTLDRIDRLLVTLEPCNHFGRQGPCTHAILQARIRQVVALAKDPNPNVAGQGIEYLRSKGVDASFVSDSELTARARNLIRAFDRHIRTGLPWVTLKRALDEKSSLIPPPGQKTFTGPASLRLAHELRKRSDAILTGSGTVLADRPEFTVRHVPDHAGKVRWLVVLDRRGRVASQVSDWVKERENSGFRVKILEDLDEAFSFLGKQGVLEVLVEAGPELSQTIEARSLWNERVTIRKQPSGPDQIETEVRSIS